MASAEIHARQRELIVVHDARKAAASGEAHQQVELKVNGGDDGTRTRGLCRDSVALIGSTTTYNNAGTAKNTRKSHKTSSFVGWVVGWKSSVLRGVPNSKALPIVLGTYPQLTTKGSPESAEIAKSSS